MKCVVLDGSKITDKSTLHEVLKVELELPEHYGENLDALWDCITAWIDLPIELVWKNYIHSKDKLGEYYYKVIKLFEDAKEAVDGFNYRCE